MSSVNATMTYFLKKTIYVSQATDADEISEESFEDKIKDSKKK